MDQNRQVFLVEHKGGGGHSGGGHSGGGMGHGGHGHGGHGHGGRGWNGNYYYGGDAGGYGYYYGYPSDYTYYNDYEYPSETVVNNPYYDFSNAYQVPQQGSYSYYQPQKKMRVSPTGLL